MIIEEAVARAGIPVELISLAMFNQFGFMLVDLFRCWTVVIIAKDAQYGAGEIGGVVNRTDGALWSQVLRSHDVAREVVQLAEQTDLVILGLQRHGRRKKTFGQVALRIAADTRCGIIMISGRG